jgi:pimeloyl-ACP methyl ester carboxylesterase
MTTIASDWNDIGAVVDHLLALRHVSQVSLVAWSLGGPRAGGYAAQHPEKVQKLVLLAPGYNELNATEKPPPSQVPAAGAAMNTQSRDDFTALWNRRSSPESNHLASQGIQVLHFSVSLMARLPSTFWTQVAGRDDAFSSMAPWHSALVGFLKRVWRPQPSTLVPQRATLQPT